MNGRIVAGLVLVALGLTFGLDRAGLVDAGVLFGTLWPLVLVALGVLWLARGPRILGATFVVLGAVFLLQELDYLPDNVWEYVWPAILVIVGLAILFGGRRRRARGHAWGPPHDERWRHADAATREQRPDAEGRFDQSAVLSGRNSRVVGALRTGEVNAVLGSVDLDLTAATLPPEGATLDASVVLGAVNLIVPRAWRVEMTGTPILGGIDDRTRPGDGAVLRVRASVVLGSVEARNARVEAGPGPGTATA